jgi:hypothetical protein
MANRLKMTDKKKRLFIAELCKDGNVSAACRRLNLARETVYHHFRLDPEFYAAKEEAIDVGIDALIDECRRRANGFYTDVYDKDGKKTGKKFTASDVLAMFLIKGRRPEYRERMLDIPPDGKFSLNINTDSSGGDKNSDG